MSALICQWFDWHAEKNISEWCVCVRSLNSYQPERSNNERLENYNNKQLHGATTFFIIFDIKVRIVCGLAAIVVCVICVSLLQVWKCFKDRSTQNDKTKSMPQHVGLVHFVALLNFNTLVHRKRAQTNEPAIIRWQWTGEQTQNNNQHELCVRRKEEKQSALMFD